MILSISSEAVADPVIDEGVRDGDRVCYSLAGFKQLLVLREEFKSCASERDLLEQKVNIQKEIILNLKQVDAAQKNSIEILSAGNARLFEAWRKENKLRHEAENVPAWGSFLPWTIAGVASIVAGGAVIYAVTK